MIQTILITGASKGIGAACLEQAAALNLNIIATARSSDKLKNLHKKYNNVQIIIADIATETGRMKIAESVKKPIDFLLHNAAILDSPQAFMDLTIGNFRNNIVTNVEPLIFLTQRLLPHLTHTQVKSRILSMSSGAANNAIAGLGNYCISKAAALMANEVLKIELNGKGILVNDYFPGVVDTNMQKTLRSSNNQIFPYSDNFKQLKKDHKLSNPKDIAVHIMSIFTQVSDEDFNQNQWFYTQSN